MSSTTIAAVPSASLVVVRAPVGSRGARLDPAGAARRLACAFEERGHRQLHGEGELSGDELGLVVAPDPTPLRMNQDRDEDRGAGDREQPTERRRLALASGAAIRDAPVYFRAATGRQRALERRRRDAEPGASPSAIPASAATNRSSSRNGGRKARRIGRTATSRSDRIQRTPEKQDIDKRAHGASSAWAGYRALTR